ncbi:MAG: Uma2 family endonuclease [Blastocatellia bacterium]|nr:Uma2 family endonuclease [Blastocatellia bacterium]
MAQPIPHLPCTEEEYLAAEREAFERSEYIDGVIYAMAGESPAHGAISANLVALIVTHLRGTPCQAFTKDMKVRSGPLPVSKRNRKGLYSYPDLLVVCGALQTLDEHKDVILNPRVILEVLSDSTLHFDRVEKFQRYQKYLPSLMDYVMVSQQLALIEIFHRDSPEAPSWRYFSANDLQDTITIPSIECPLPLSAIYDRVTFPPPREEDLDEEEAQA